MSQAVKPISAMSGEGQVETGLYAVSGNQIDWTPRESTCPGPDPAYSFSFTLDGGGLTMVPQDATAPTHFVRGTHASDGGNGSLELGCFQSGYFVQAPLGPVSN